MDINYLLLLQNFRNSTNDILTPFMNSISDFGEYYLFLIVAFLYWCYDKRRGLLTLAALYLSLALSAVIKLTACVYRPWIKDPRIIPAGKLPGSYSFPSGHTTMATPMYLGSAIIFWQKKKTKILAVICIILALLTGFSRNYLGVHTPQDVIVGLLLSIACVYSVWKTGAYLQKYPPKENKVLFITAIFCVLAFIFILYKSYPMDYIDGKLLVNPKKALSHGYFSIGSLFAFCIARYIEKTWIKFKETGLNLKGCACGFAGLVILFILITYTSKPLKHLLGSDWGRGAYAFCLVFYIVALYPLIIKLIFAKKK